MELISWEKLIEYFSVGAAVFLAGSYMFSSVWWTSKKVWMFTVAGTFGVYYFTGILDAVYFFLIVLAINANSNDKMFKL